MNKNIESLYDKYKTREQGLTDHDAKLRLEENGRNVFPVGKQKSAFLILLNQFKLAIIIILFIAIALSFVIGEYANIIFIGAVTVKIHLLFQKNWQVISFQIVFCYRACKNLG